MTDPVEPANLRFLRRLVTVLTATMLIGVVVVVGLLVTRLSSKGPDLPEMITLPDGSEATAFTQGDTWYAIVTSGNEVLIYNRTDGTLKQTITLE
ncbi:MAG: DUF6476 family protein [Ascidiaceihabitans sp.]|nr:DUF6476 family protein [Ascidiaceihabitans sp.]